MTGSKYPLISVVIPVHNGSKFVDSCFESILNQDFLNVGSLEISVYDDCSSDGTYVLLNEWKNKLSSRENVTMVISRGDSNIPKGVGYAKNRAVEQSHGAYLCFQDIDDIMLPSRITKQLMVANKNSNTIVGSKIQRLPENSTPRFVSWTNNLPKDLLQTQIYTSHGPTVLMPTWFMHKSVFERVGGFSEGGRGIPEDLLFFYRHIDEGGKIDRVDEILLIYSYHPDCTTFSVPERKIWDIRMERLENLVLPQWESFTIWNAGKQGRKFFRSLKNENKRKVIQFCDVDVKKTGKYYEPYFKLVGNLRIKIPIVHFSNAKPPFVICVKLDMTNGEFENNLGSLALIEGKDYVLFS